MKIQIGGKNKKYYLDAFKKADIKVSDWAKDLIDKVEFQRKKEIIEVEIISVKELGFTDWTRRDVIYAKAKEKGFDILPAEATLAFRLAYKDQPMGEWMLMGMEPISDSGGALRVFRVERSGGGRWLDSGHGSPGNVWVPGDRWVFARRKYQNSETGNLDPALILEPLELRIKKIEETLEKIKEAINT